MLILNRYRNSPSSAIGFATLFIIAGMVSTLFTAALMNAGTIKSIYLPIILLITFVICLVWFRRLDLNVLSEPLTASEYALIGYAVTIGVLHLTPYVIQYQDHILVNAVNDDDLWHFQEVASLVNTDAFPPKVNFYQSSYLHFYYLPWIPAAALSKVASIWIGSPLIKLSFGVCALLIAIASTVIWIAFIRHVLKKEARIFAVLCLIGSGAVVEGLGFLLHLAQGRLQSVEWWERTSFDIYNQFSTWTTLLVWVPHHLISASALLLAFVVVVEPITLLPRKSLLPYIVAGFLVSFSLFSSIFAFIGGIIVLSPIIVRLIGFRYHILASIVAALIPAVPLFYIYTSARAAGGFQVLQPFFLWNARFHNYFAGLIGLIVAGLLMIVEVGWLFVVGRFFDDGLYKNGLRQFAYMAFAFLVSTIFISFKGANNYEGLSLSIRLHNMLIYELDSKPAKSLSEIQQSFLDLGKHIIDLADLSGGLPLFECNNFRTVSACESIIVLQPTERLLVFKATLRAFQRCLNVVSCKHGVLYPLRMK